MKNSKNNKAGRNFIVIDTEGVNIAPVQNGNIAATARSYDIAWIVANGNGEVLDRFSFVNVDVFYQNDLMETAYYAEKLPQYHAGIGTEWIPANFFDIWQTFCKCVVDYKVTDVWAYNVNYDRIALNNTIKDASNGFRRYFAPFGVKFRDIWDYAGSTICNTKKYVNWCFVNGFISDKGNPLTNADTVGKYVTGNLDFEEKHTALCDCEIELQILLAAKRRKQKARKSSGQGWRDASRIAKELKATA